MPNVFNYLALISESPEGLRRGSEFRAEIEVGAQNHERPNVFLRMLRVRSAGVGSVQQSY